jgi:hypothetical protein
MRSPKRYASLYIFGTADSAPAASWARVPISQAPRWCFDGPLSFWLRGKVRLKRVETRTGIQLAEGDFRESS